MRQQLFKEFPNYEFKKTFFVDGSREQITGILGYTPLVYEGWLPPQHRSEVPWDRNNPEIQPAHRPLHDEPAHYCFQFVVLVKTDSDRVLYSIWNSQNYLTVYVKPEAYE